MKPIRFERQQHLERFIHVYSPGDETPVEVHWPGLYRDWPDIDRTPFTEFAIDNCEQEEIAVYFGLAWQLTKGLARYAIPTWYRDDAARRIGAPFEFVDWEYSVNAEMLAAGDRVVGFVRARVVLPPEPTLSEREHRFQAGLFDLHAFHDLILLQRALSDASSAINLFAVRPGPDRKRRLVEALRSPMAPRLNNVLDEGEMLIDVTIGMDVGNWSSVTVASLTDLQARLEELSAEFGDRVIDYENSASAIRDVPGFLSAMRRLTALG